MPDLINVGTDLFGEGDRTSWETVEKLIGSSGESEKGIEINLAVARALYDFANNERVVSYPKPVNSWSVGFGHSVNYWEPFYSIWGDKATFVHFDPRKSNPLNASARRFAFSLMHQRLRIEDPDFHELDLKIFRFGTSQDGTRFIRVHSATDCELYTLDELNEMIDRTYGLWLQELSERIDAARSATGTDNPMGF